MHETFHVSCFVHRPTKFNHNLKYVNYNTGPARLERLAAADKF